MVRTVILSALLSASMAAATPSHAENCIADWSVAAEIVHKNGLATVETLTQRARTKLVGSIMQTMLCEARGGYRYRMVVRAPNGQLHTVVVDAAHPFE